jgi:hypothetical protein
VFSRVLRTFSLCLNAYPAGQLPTSNLSVWSWTGTGRQTQTENFGLARVDHRFSDHILLYARFNLDQGQLSVPNGDSSGYLTDTVLTEDNPKNGIVDLENIFSPNLINEMKAGVNRVPFTTTNQSVIPIQVQVAGLTTLHDNLQQVQHMTTYSFADTLSYVKGRHSIKTGFGLRRVQMNLGNTAETQLTYASLANFQANNLDSAAILAAVPTAGCAKPSTSPSRRTSIRFDRTLRSASAFVMTTSALSMKSRTADARSILKLAPEDSVRQPPPGIILIQRASARGSRSPGRRKRCTVRR